MRSGALTEAVQELLSRKPHTYVELAKELSEKDNKYHKIMSAVHTLDREGRLSVFAVPRGIGRGRRYEVAYASKTAQNDLRGKLQKLESDTGVIEGTSIGIYSSSESIELLSSQIAKSSMPWDLEAHDHIESGALKYGDADRVRQAAYHLIEAMRTLDSSIYLGMTKKVRASLSQRDRDRFDRIERELPYFGFLFARFYWEQLDYPPQMYGIKEPAYGLSKETAKRRTSPKWLLPKNGREIESALRRALKELKISSSEENELRIVFRQMASRKGRKVSRLLREWFLSSPPDQSTKAGALLEKNLICRISLTDEEGEEYQRLDKETDFYYEMTQRAKEQAAAADNALLVVASMKPFDQMNYEKQIPKLISELSFKELDQIAKLFVSPEEPYPGDFGFREYYQRYVPKIMERLELWPPEGGWSPKLQSSVLSFRWGAEPEAADFEIFCAYLIGSALVKTEKLQPEVVWKIRRILASMKKEITYTQLSGQARRIAGF